ncbi:hypothetical protein [Ruegeria conchae]|uniref:hypothetical protein n=1 Tax=Ruegeria conchae TaxID=981384 RepID=UPI0029C920F9|nr:hypothetical protein [Ruegeria conchae]
MLNLSELPKEPIAALHKIIVYMMGKSGNGSAQIGKLKQTNHHLFSELLSSSLVAKSAASRVNDEAVRQSIQENLTLKDELSLQQYNAHLTRALSLVLALQFDDHFIDDDLDKEFDQAELSTSEKERIRELMYEARRIIDRATTLPGWARRKMLYHVSKIENELHREISRFQSFIAAASDVSDLVRKFGTDAQPLAEAISEARTITERKVEGYAQIEREAEPKRIPKFEETKD